MAHRTRGKVRTDPSDDDEPARNHPASVNGSNGKRSRKAARSFADNRIFGPYSRAIDRGGLGWAISGRSREGRFITAYEAMLIEHVGGAPTIVQRALISRAARLALHLELMDEKSLADGRAFTIHDHHYYLSWSNGLARLLGRIGIQAAAAPPPSLRDYFEERGAAD